MIESSSFLLAIETSSKQGSVALLKMRGKIHTKRAPSLLGESLWDAESNSPHSEVITLHISECLKQAQMELSDLNLLAVSLGPGSFTGIRVGINVTRSLAFALSLPILAVNSLRVLAQSISKKSENVLVCSLMNAYRQEFYTAFFEKKERQVIETVSPCLLNLNQLTRKIQKMKPRDLSLLCLGDGYSLIEKQLQFSPLLKECLKREESLFDFPLARHLGQAVLQDQTQNSLLTWRQLKPLYLRGSSAEEKLRKIKRTCRF